MLFFSITGGHPTAAQRPVSPAASNGAGPSNATPAVMQGTQGTVDNIEIDGDEEASSKKPVASDAVAEKWLDKHPWLKFTGERSNNNHRKGVCTYCHPAHSINGVQQSAAQRKAAAGNCKFATDEGAVVPTLNEIKAHEKSVM